MTWYCLKVAPGALTVRHLTVERARGTGRIVPLGFPVEAILRRRGLEPFIPVESIFIRRDRYHLGAKKRVKRALLPGMVFLNLSAPVNWLDVLSTPMVSGVFGLNGKPYAFREDEDGRCPDIDRLISISEDLRMPEYYSPMPTRRTYDVGDTVVDLTGVFEGAFKVIEIEGSYAKILAPLFGELREVTTQASHLAKVV